MCTCTLYMCTERKEAAIENGGAKFEYKGKDRYKEGCHHIAFILKLLLC